MSAALLIPAIAGILDKIIPDPAQAAEAKAKLLEIGQRGELAQLAAAVQILVAEASGSIMQRNWRPVVMLTFCGLIVARWLGWAAPNLSEAEYLKLWDIVEFGLGGYVVGRSAEKIIPATATAIASAIKDRRGVGPQGEGP